MLMLNLIVIIQKTAPITPSEDELYLNKHRELGLSHYDTRRYCYVVYNGESVPY